MKRSWLLLILGLSACSHQQVYNSTVDMREQACERQYGAHDPQRERCIEEARLSYEESQRRLEPRAD